MYPPFGLSAPYNYTMARANNNVTPFSDDPDYSLDPSALEQFSQSYAKIHPVLAVALACIGIATNIFFLAVLRHPSLRNPTNSLLKAVAVTGVLLLAFYTGYIIKFEFSRVTSPNQVPCITFSLPWAIFMLLYAYASISVYGSSVYLLVLLGAYRLYVLSQARTDLSGHMKKVGIAAFITTAMTQIVCIPYYLSVEISKLAKVWTMCEHGYQVGDSRLAKKHPWMKKAVLWINGIGFKAIPCVLLTVIFIILMVKLSKFNKRNHRLLGHRRAASSHANLSMLTILGMFILTQMPQALLNVLSGMYGNEFKYNVYDRLGDVMDLLSILNSVISFPLYCFTNTQIRRRISQAVKCRVAVVT